MATGRVPTTANSPLTAKGDLFTYSTAPARLAVGNNGETLVADSGTATGLRYQGNYAAGKNGLINGAANISQRGATITGINTDNTYTADRWYITRGGLIDYAQKTVAGGSTPPATFDAYAQYINQSAANPFVTIEQTLETKDSLRFANQSVTFSFYARAAANTAKSKSLKASVTYNTTADTKTNTVIGNTTFTLLYGTTAGDWTRCTLTATVPSTAKSVGVRFVSEPAGGLAVGDGYEITGMQLENGSVMTQFQTATATIQGELAACQRYYQRKTSVGNATVFGMGQASSTTQAYYSIPIPVSFRVAPSVSHSSAAGWTSSTGSAGGTIAAFQMSADSVSLQISGGAGLVAGNASALVGTSGSAYLELSAEL